jgi:hypothetical protein
LGLRGGRIFERGMILREGLLDNPGQCKLLGHVITQWGFLMGGTEKGFLDFLTLVDEW